MLTYSLGTKGWKCSSSILTLYSIIDSCTFRMFKGVCAVNISDYKSITMQNKNCILRDVSLGTIMHTPIQQQPFLMLLSSCISNFPDSTSDKTKRVAILMEISRSVKHNFNRWVCIHFFFT